MRAGVTLNALTLKEDSSKPISNKLCKGLLKANKFSKGIPKISKPVGCVTLKRLNHLFLKGV